MQRALPGLSLRKHAADETLRRARLVGCLLASQARLPPLPNTSCSARCLLTSALSKVGPPETTRTFVSTWLAERPPLTLHADSKALRTTAFGLTPEAEDS